MGHGRGRGPRLGREVGRFVRAAPTGDFKGGSAPFDPPEGSLRREPQRCAVHQASTSAISTGSPVPRRRICCTTQCLSLLIGRDSAITTVSPTSQRLSSSCALKLRVRRRVRPYRRWRVTISTATTTVLFILLLATRPVFVRRGLRSSGIRSQLPLALQGLDAGDIPPHGADPRRVGQLPRRELKSQLEHLLAELAQARLRVGYRLGGLRAAATSRLFLPTRLPRLPLRHSRG